MFLKFIIFIVFPKIFAHRVRLQYWPPSPQKFPPPKNDSKGYSCHLSHFWRVEIFEVSGTITVRPILLLHPVDLPNALHFSQRSELDISPDSFTV